MKTPAFIQRIRAARQRRATAKSEGRTAVNRRASAVHRANLKEKVAETKLDVARREERSAERLRDHTNETDDGSWGNFFLWRDDMVNLYNKTEARKKAKQRLKGKEAQATRAREKLAEAVEKRKKLPVWIKSNEYIKTKGFPGNRATTTRALLRLKRRQKKLTPGEREVLQEIEDNHWRARGRKKGEIRIRRMNIIADKVNVYKEKK
ncbi:MAG: hypothetical protein NTZ73_03385 [Candidatus Diapherotrites archaeon]|nr:hypothetical protein [Candidatus Diapherotrites archaeon]